MSLQKFFLVHFPSLSAQKETDLRIRLASLQWKCQQVPKGLRRTLVHCQGNPHVFMIWSSYSIKSSCSIKSFHSEEESEKGKCLQTLDFLQSWKPVQKICNTFQGELCGTVFYDKSQQMVTILSKKKSEYALKLTTDNYSVSTALYKPYLKMTYSLISLQDRLLSLLKYRNISPKL